MDIIYFSACGNSKNIARQTHDNISKDSSVNIFDVTLSKMLNMSGDLLIIVAPVFNDKPPKPLIDLINNAALQYSYYAVIATYGGVTCKNSLYYTQKILSYKDISCVGLSSVVSNYSYLTQDTCNRDYTKIIDKIIKNIYNNIKIGKIVTIRANNSYSAIKRIIDKNHNKLFPQPVKNIDKCINCGRCLAVCPSNISCINCMACVKVCPSQAMRFMPKYMPIIGIKAIRLIKNKYKIY